MLPPSLEDLIDKTHAVRVVNQVIDRIDLDPQMKTYKGGGTSSYHPRMLLKVLDHAYLNNTYSSRRVEAAVKENMPFMWRGLDKVSLEIGLLSTAINLKKWAQIHAKRAPEHIQEGSIGLQQTTVPQACRPPSPDLIASHTLAAPLEKKRPPLSRRPPLSVYVGNAVYRATGRLKVHWAQGVRALRKYRPVAQPWVSISVRGLSAGTRRMACTRPVAS